MKAFISQETDAIDVDDEFINLVNFSRRRRRFTYEFAVRVNQIRAIKLRANRLRITLRYPSENKRKTLFDSDQSMSPEEAIDAILMDKPKTKDRIRSKRRNIISRRNIDITNRLNNEIARYVDRFGEEDAVTLLPTIRAYEFKTVQALREENSETSYVNDTVTYEDYSTAKSADLVPLSLEAINRFHKDPANLVMCRDKINTQDDAIRGTLKTYKSEKDAKKSKIVKTLRKDLIEINNVASIDELPPGELIPVLVRRKKQYVTVRRRINIRNKVFRRSRNLEVVVELLDREGAIVQRETHKLNHSKYYNDYTIPRVSPLIRYVNCVPGKNVLEIRQRDKKCNAIEVYRRKISDSDVLINSDYELVGRYRIRKRGRSKTTGGRFLRIIDEVQNTNPIIYRAIPVRGRRRGYGFKSVVAPPCKIGLANQVVRNKFSSIFVHPVEEGLSIEVKNFDTSAGTLRVLRKDLSAKERDYRPLTEELKDVTTPDIIIDSESMSFIDTSVRDGRTYEYTVDLTYVDGTRIRTIGTAFTEYHALDNEIEFEVEDVNVSNFRAPNVRMTIDTDETQTRGKTNLANMLKNYIKRSGTKSFYNSEEQEEELRDEADLLTVFSIERHNLTTGEREQFNIFNPASSPIFDDARLSRSSRLKPLEAGNEYRYVVTGCRIHPASLFRRSKIKRIDRRTKRKYSISVAKKLSRKTLRTGTILPRRGRSRNTGKNTIFNAAKTGSVKIVKVDLRDNMPAIKTGDVERINNYENKLTWSVQGDASKIDHFIISIDRRRSSIPVFHAIALSGRNRYVLIDRFTPKIRGPVEFKITPVYVDFTRGETVQIGQIVSSGIASKRRRQGRRY